MDKAQLIQKLEEITAERDSLKLKLELYHIPQLWGSYSDSFVVQVFRTKEKAEMPRHYYLGKQMTALPLYLRAEDYFKQVASASEKEGR